MFSAVGLYPGSYSVLYTLYIGVFMVVNKDWTVLYFLFRLVLADMTMRNGLELVTTEIHLAALLK